MWQIVTVAVLGFRIKSAYVPLILRAGVILIFACAAAILRALASTTLLSGSGLAEVSQAQILLPALLLLCVAALASLPLPSAVPPVVPALAETLTAAVIVGGLGKSGLLFLPYLTVPLFLAGLLAGLAAGLACAALACVSLGATLTASSAVSSRNGTLTLLLAWLFIFVAVPFLGAWIRRLRSQTAPETEPAYADAHRLLSELHVVARQLSLGLDPRTLAAALVDDIRVVVTHCEAVVLARSPGGRFVALAGAEPPDAAEGAIEDAWVSAVPVKRSVHGACFAAVPVLMGERVVALVVVTTESPLDGPTLRSCRSVVKESGPRLASAMLFDDVRRLATTDERMRLAREIHDGIAQDLASVGYVLDDIRRDSTPELADRVMALREQLQNMVADLRMSIFDLRAGLDDSIGLGTSLSEHAQRIGGQAGLIVTTSIDESPKRLPITVEVELMRIVQEAITNVRRHANAERLMLTVVVEPPSAYITVVDDGRGLRPGRPDSFGITGMKERASRIGANLRVVPNPAGPGTMVEIVLGTEPLTEGQPPLPQPAVRRGALTNPHGLPALVSHSVSRTGAPAPAEQE